MAADKEPTEGKKGEGKAEETEGSSPALSYLQLFRYADTLDYVYLFFGTLGAVVNGSALPVFFFFLSGLLDSFGKYARDDPIKAADEVTKYVLNFVYVSLVAFAGAYAEVSFWMQTGERQSARVRSLYLRAILRQDVGYFDTVASTGDIVSRVSSDTLLFQDAIGEKVGNFIHNVSTFVAGFIVAFVQVWQITLLMAAFIPVLAIPGILYARVLTGLTAKESAAYSEAGSIAEQSISSVRTVYSFVGESKTLENYSAALKKSFKTGLKQGMAKGMALGANGLMFCLWSLMFWFGGKLVISGDATGGKVLGTAFSVIIGGLALGQAMPNLKAFSKGRIAGYRIFEMIDRVPPIDSDDPNGQTLPKVIGNIELKNVSFTYPARPDVPIFTNFSLRIPSGKTVALVGSSGSGKSTVISLIERFYDPLGGEVLIDGVNIKSLQLKWLRLQIGLVSQEPALFATSIKENIKYGKEGATDEEIEAAAKAANAYKFISDLPEKFDTRVGERGVQMSGGQKQRIAIARAILKNPPILLLDEATSALDAESERIVQEALDNASVGRTTVVVAHRLSTIRNADVIAVVHKGSVVETGSHDELISKPDGAYTSLVNLQNKRRDEGENDKTEEDRSSTVKKSIDKRVSLQLSSLSGLSDGHVSEKEGGEKAPPQPSFSRLLYLNKPEWKEALLGTVGGILVGLVNPFWAFVVAYVIGVYFNPDHHYIRKETVKYAIIFLGFGVYSFVVNILLHYFYGAVGEHLTKRVREMMLSTMLKQEVGWFDREENSSGALTSKLSTDATLVRALVGDRMSLLVQTFSSVGVTIILGLALQWKLALVMLSTLPLMMFSFLIQNWMLKGFSAETAKAQEQASQVAAEAVSQHRTVTAFSSQDKVLGLFDSKLEGPLKLSWVRSQTAGVGLGFSQFILFNSWGLALWYGSQLAKNEGVSFTNVFKVFLVVISVGFGLAEAASLAPDFARGGQAVASVFGILDRETEIDADSGDGEEPEKIEGSIDVRNVKFAYPSRPDVLVFDDFSIKVPAGTTTAFVGQSGSGKSTIIGLIERFYDPLHGRVLIDGKDIKKYNLKALRRFIGLVQQEPVLFATSIYENITYGLDRVSEAEVENAAKAANAHTFISGLPDGYQTFCGERGVQLSGGQKQRIAIARAVLKNPAILLLDEATSALDAESEKVVQDALDKIMVGRTTIVVAHRLSTIRNADSIAVLQKGKLVELGSHDTLMQKGDTGAYYSLVKLQMHTS